MYVNYFTRWSFFVFLIPFFGAKINENFEFLYFKVLNEQFDKLKN